MKKVRIGIIGIGNMGMGHAKYLHAGDIQGAELTAVCDINPDRLQEAEEQFGDSVQRFSKASDLYASGLVDAVFVATPHYDHPPLVIQGFEHDLHMLTEKPAGVYTKQVLEMNRAAKKSGKVFGIMFNQRTNPLYQKLRDLIQSGELGTIKRINWIITSWYRSQSYYDSGGWRATWSGEGGGVLLNQDPHQLDLWQWMFGLPLRIRAFCGFGRFHDIEVEDDVTAYMEYENGVSGVFVTSTGDAPGTNRLEVSADNGQVIVEGGALRFNRLRVPESQFTKEFKGGFGSPEAWKCEVPVRGKATEHRGITQNFVRAILTGSDLLAPGEEGVRGLQLSNAMHLSAWLDNWVSLPVDEDLFYQHLQERISNSKEKKAAAGQVLDVEGTF